MLRLSATVLRPQTIHRKFLYLLTFVENIEPVRFTDRRRKFLEARKDGTNLNPIFAVPRLSWKCPECLT